MHALNPSLLVLSITGFGHDGEIARSLHDLIGLASPTLSVLLGQGTGGGALALFPADRTIAAQHGWLSPLPPPEGASAIVHCSTALPEPGHESVTVIGENLREGLRESLGRRWIDRCGPLWTGRGSWHLGNSLH